MDRNNIVNYLNSLLNISEISDSCCNWLQVEWSKEIKKIWLAVDACMSTYKSAIQAWCQMLIAHHWMIWWWLKSISWTIYKQIKILINSWMNLYCVHLPLDLHPKYWNNACLAKLIDLKKITWFWNYNWMKIWFKWELTKQLTCEQIAKIFEWITWREPSILSFWKEKNKKIWIISWWASNNDLLQASKEWLDCYITWEWSHANYHLALEEWINVIYLGHYHSEKIWVIALWKHLEQKFKIKTQFIDEPSVF